MLAPVFWLVSLIAVVSSLYQLIKRKNLFGISTYIMLGVYLPLFLSFVDWSEYHVSKRCIEFYYIFIVFGVLLTILNLIPQPKLELENMRFVRKRKSMPVEVFNLLFIAAILLENYYVSGMFFPSLIGIDIHTERMPYIYFITTGVYVISILNLIEFLITKKLRYIFYIVITVAINVVTKSARVDAFICVVQIASVGAFYYFSRRKYNRYGTRGIKKKKWPFILLTAGILAVVVSASMAVGDNRMNHFGLYQIVYSDGIRYTGPTFMGEILPYYYGYFALSFDNLAYNLSNQSVTPNMLGLSTFRTLWFGVLQFDNLFDLTGSGATFANMIRCAGAAVATGFWDMYYDYGVLIFIPFSLSFFIYYKLRRTVSRKRIKAENFVLYFYWVPLWFFMSFDNRVYDFQILWHVLLLYLLVSRRYSLVFGIEAAAEEIREKKKRRHIKIPHVKLRWKG